MIAAISILFIFIILDKVFPFRPAPDYSQLIEASDGSILFSFLNNSQKWRMETQLDEITPELRKIIIYKEDKYFRYHPGVNIIAVFRAAVQNIFHRRVKSGASTITMQVVRLLEPKERTYFNKFIEMFRALQLEWHYSKKEILQLYLNLVPYGSNIEGVKSASMLYFEQTPDALSLAQIVTLAIIPNNPSKMRIGHNNSYIMQKRNSWLRYFFDKGVISDKEFSDAVNEPLSAYRHEAPKKAPHLAHYLRSAYPNIKLIKTCIRSQTQEKIEHIAWQYIRNLRSMNITNAAVLVINNRTHAVEAYAGSADFFDDQYQGQVNGIRSKRSPGSALKPFLYAGAMDAGMVTPKTVIMDIPVNFNGYSPENYDGRFNGYISVEKSLALSLNSPAVRLLEEYGTEKFTKNLIRLGFKSIDQKKQELGLSLILGGCGVSLEELTTAYSIFANKGKLISPKYLITDSLRTVDSIFSQEAAFMTTGILSQLTRPDLPNKFENSVHLPRIAWKTGTSYGRRDAWAIGYNRDYTIGVWVGNFPGQGVAELSGADYAVPLLFRIFNTINYNSEKDWFIEPDNLDFRLVCSLTGLLPNDSCTDLVTDEYIPMVSSNQKCMHLKEVFVSPDEKISYCRSCMPELGYKRKFYPNLHPEMISFYEDQHIPFQKIPPHNPVCERIYKENAPKITSLLDGAEYILFKNESQKLMLKCSAESDVQTIYWYVNNKFLKNIRVNESSFFEPPDGEVKISCTDDKGRNTDIRIKIERIQ
jgi:penicillin-binding protein 1C